jgi:hypothetical protein
MMPSAQKILAAASTAAILLVASVPAAVGASVAPLKLTKATAAAAALKDAKAGATISGGDKVIVSNCRPYGRSAFKCSIQLTPQSSASRCHWTDTVKLVKGKFDVQYSRIVCSG